MLIQFLITGINLMLPNRRPFTDAFDCILQTQSKDIQNVELENPKKLQQTCMPNVW